MARIRSVKPELFASYTLAQVSIEARFVFVALFTEADDEGRLIDSPKRIAGTVFPHDEKVTESKVNQWLDDLQKIGCILRYYADEGRYISIPKWESHQKISHPTPSKFPTPSGKIPESFRTPPETFVPEQGTGNREQGTGSGTGSAAKLRSLPDDFVVSDEMRTWASQNCTHVDISHEGKRFTAWAEASGKRYVNWVATWRNWMLRVEGENRDKGLRTVVPTAPKSCRICGGIDHDHYHCPNKEKILA